MCSYSITMAQQDVQFIPLQHAWSARLTASIDTLVHDQVKPFNPFRFGYLATEHNQTLRLESPLGKDSWLTNAIFNDYTLDIRHKDFSILAHPLLDITLGEDNRSDEQIYRNTRGLQLQGRIGPNVAFYTDFQETQTRFPLYVREWVGGQTQQPARVMPGQGIRKTFKGDPTQYDFAYSSGWVNWELSRFFNLQFGYGKNFIGEGYRSLLLSDNAFNYPYLRIQTSFWKVQYTNLFTELRDINTTLPDGTFPRKYMVSHYLSMNIGKKINVGLFEAVVYGDSLGTRGFEAAYLNPILFYRPVEFAIGSNGGNVLLGLQASYQASRRLEAYGQLVFDEFKIDELRAGDGWWGNKFGIQLGLKGQLQQPELQYRIEFNTVRPYTYGHAETLQNYGHYNQSLAHPLGGNFRELVAQLNYYRGRWFAEAQLNYQQIGLDSLGSHWGSNVYLDNNDREQEYGNTIGQGVSTSNLIAQLRFGWIINPAYNLRLEAGFVRRTFEPEFTTGRLSTNTTNYWYLGVRTALHNTYYDF